MKEQKCWSVVSEKIASVPRAPEKERLRILESYCGAIDDIIDEFNGEMLAAGIDPESMLIAVKFQTVGFVTRNMTHPLCQLLKRAIAVRFSNIDHEFVGIEIVFPSIWGDK